MHGVNLLCYQGSSLIDTQRGSNIFFCFVPKRKRFRELELYACCREARMHSTAQYSSSTVLQCLCYSIYCNAVRWTPCASRKNLRQQECLHAGWRFLSVYWGCFDRSGLDHWIASIVQIGSSTRTDCNRVSIVLRVQYSYSKKALYRSFGISADNHRVCTEAVNPKTILGWSWIH